ncbi:hypothetical protein [Pseudomonas vancouverensis]|uniref:Uncharacterized protein n=1 Tax=Pseudomonas vancouverensis TaxID=95300 RepID=A0A1H2MW99_PSEVA|nr:hypothetical protein [Pseudomonas vancouverensis]KAB0489794.1 hypothetical protein F7R09_28370 [Pseudomonas vancouverensis]TDB69306.1 hypothetical protein EIY72_00075 [Pseudomonas vancouverensis]SDU97519.1 hypothetical protein SAMN05216558_1369 [Pseudomonas vancouverensis]
MNQTLYGTVQIDLDGEAYTLKPTLGAVRAIESHFGGLRGASQAINALSVDGCAVIIASGAGLTGKAAEGVAEQVWQTGVLKVSVQLNAYLVALYNPKGPDSGKDQPAAA